MVVQPINQVKIFYSCNHEDHALKKLFAKHLSSLYRHPNITIDTDLDIQAGVEWKRKSKELLDAADIILLLISADFMASDYHHETMTHALEKQRMGTAWVIPILLRPCAWEETPLGKLPPLPTNRWPVTQWENQDAAWRDVIREIEKVVTQMIQLIVAKNTPPPAAPHLVEHFSQPEQPVDELYEESVRAQERGQIKIAFQGYQQIVSSRNTSANQITYAKNKLQELREPYIALFIREARTHAQAGRWHDIETIMTELQQLQPPPSRQELKALHELYIALFIREARIHAQAGRWHETKAALTKLQQLQPPPSTRELKVLRKLYIAKLVEEAGKYCQSGDWDAEINVWQELLQFNPTEGELRGQPIFVASTGRSMNEREAKHTCIEIRISIAEQNKQHSELYKRARQAIARGEKAVARDHLQSLWDFAPYYGDPAQIAHQTGIASSRNCEERSKRLEAMLYKITFFMLTLGAIIAIFTFILSKGNASEVYFQITVIALPLLSAIISATTAYYKTAGAAGVGIPVIEGLTTALAQLILPSSFIIGCILAGWAFIVIITGYHDFSGVVTLAAILGGSLALSLILFLSGKILGASSLGAGIEIGTGIAGIGLLLYLGAPIPVLAMDGVAVIISLSTIASVISASRSWREPWRGVLASNQLDW